MIIEHTPSITQSLKCYHCGDDCPSDMLRIEDKFFCCNGCKIVYEVLAQNDLCTYYSIQEYPGIKQASENAKQKYEYLDDAEIRKQLISFSDEQISVITFFVPDIHCSSCIYLLENLNLLEKEIISSRVNFPAKQLTVHFNTSLLLSSIASLIVSIGYPPLISLDSLEKGSSPQLKKKLWKKLGIAGFAFGNIMMLSFPEYLGLDDASSRISEYFSYIILLFSIPVLFYSASDYFLSSYYGLKKKAVTIDVPLALGILALYFKSVFDIVSETGPGYMDSFAGLIFFLLLGKLFQQKTYEIFNFERNYKSYFPLSVTLLEKGKEVVKPLSKLKTGDRAVILHNEIIPADSILFKGEGKIDYSFITGESTPVEKKPGDHIYAGGKQTSGRIEIEIVKEVEQSYLTRLWNEYLSEKFPEDRFVSLANRISKYFTIIILAVASAAALFWYTADSSLTIEVFISVLIVACPCALALSSPFALGNAIRLLGRKNFFVKNTSVIEQLASADTIIFDKTGTLTETGNSDICFEGEPLSEEEAVSVRSLAANSIHPLSKQVALSLGTAALSEVFEYQEVSGLGISGVCSGKCCRLGSYSFVSNEQLSDSSSSEFSFVYLAINNNIRGRFRIQNKYRSGIETLHHSLNKYDVFLLSGDQESERANLERFGFESEKMFFRQGPLEKKRFVEDLQQKGKTVIMLGDGLNDSGALTVSNAGISVSEKSTGFTPSSDAILLAAELIELPNFLKFSKAALTVIRINFFISILYNIVGVTVAVQGLLTPLFAAVLMPLSSITAVTFATLGVTFAAKRQGLLR